eukprot:13337839-Alexandrium_andersonii.AAC.1
MAAQFPHPPAQQTATRIRNSREQRKAELPRVVDGVLVVSSVEVIGCWCGDSGFNERTKQESAGGARRGFGARKQLQHVQRLGPQWRGRAPSGGVGVVNAAGWAMMRDGSRQTVGTLMVPIGFF